MEEIKVEKDKTIRTKSCGCECKCECPVNSKVIKCNEITELCLECIICIQRELESNKKYRKLGNDDEIDYLKKVRDTVDQDIQERLFEIDPETRS